MNPQRQAHHETTLDFDSGGERLVGIVCRPAAPDRVVRRGIVIVVGGPQYRIGSHRQFVLISRALAAEGFAVLRFDCTGMGDSTGAESSFTDRRRDIGAAVDALQDSIPSIDGFVILGLCDAASAALMYVPHDPRIRQLILLNPWARSESGLARTQLKHYYTSRVLSRAFWASVFGGKVSIARAVRGFVSTAVQSFRRSPTVEAAQGSFQTRMARAWSRFDGDILLICADNDLTAREFLDHAASDDDWRGLLTQPRVTRRDCADADHTFSRQVWRDLVTTWMIEWLGDRMPVEVSASTRSTSELARA